MRSLAVAAVVLALLAGPSLGACGDCCASDPVPLSVSAASGCCGDCATTLGRSPDRVFLAASSAFEASAAAPPVWAITPAVTAGTPWTVLARAVSGASPPLPLPLPLRL